MPAGYLGASWEVAAQRELQLRCLQARRRHSSAMTLACQRRIAAPPPMTYCVRSTGMTTTGRHRRTVQIAGLTCVNVFSREPTCQAKCTSTTLEISQVNSPAFRTLQHMGPAVLHGTLCPAHLCLLAVGRTQTGPAPDTTGVSFRYLHLRFSFFLGVEFCNSFFFSHILVSMVFFLVGSGFVVFLGVLTVLGFSWCRRFSVCFRFYLMVELSAPPCFFL